MFTSKSPTSVRLVLSTRGFYARIPCSTLDRHISLGCRTEENAESVKTPLPDPTDDTATEMPVFLTTQWRPLAIGRQALNYLECTPHSGTNGTVALSGVC